ncbi:hypothetical protein HV782_011010 [Pseudomonas monsensis]|nr:hypothetical protein [Pseudomonas monsensis]QXI03273.1 hypothetical protein HV782_011010 [Pseudomonas monsensis]
MADLAGSEDPRTLERPPLACRLSPRQQQDVRQAEELEDIAERISNKYQ